MLVMDVSAAIGICRDPNAASLIDRLSDLHQKVIAPSFFMIEAANVAWKYAHLRIDDEMQAKTLFGAAYNCIDEFVDDDQLIAEALDCALSFDHSLYDMLYFVLARRASATLLTCDTKLASLCLSNNVKCVMLTEL